MMATNRIFHFETILRIWSRSVCPSTVSFKRNIFMMKKLAQSTCSSTGDFQGMSTCMQVSLDTTHGSQGSIPTGWSSNTKPVLPKNVSTRPTHRRGRDAFVQYFDPEDSKCRHRLLILEDGTTVGSDNKVQIPRIPVFAAVQSKDI